jgi:hypothetical protein
MASLTGRLSGGVRDEARERPRIRRDRDRIPDDAFCNQIGPAVVIHRDQLRGRGRGTLESHVIGVRGLVTAVAGADLRLGRPIPGKRLRLADRRRCGCVPFAEQGDADDADMMSSRPCGERT